MSKAHKIDPKITHKDFKKDDVVWAKISGFPWWPGMVAGVDLSNKTEPMFLINFIGENSHAKLPLHKIAKYKQNYDELIAQRSKLLQDSIRVADKILAGEMKFEDQAGQQTIRKKPGPVPSSNSIARNKTFKKPGSKSKGRGRLKKIGDRNDDDEEDGEHSSRDNSESDSEVDGDGADLEMENDDSQSVDREDGHSEDSDCKSQKSKKPGRGRPAKKQKLRKISKKRKGDESSGAESDNSRVREDEDIDMTEENNEVKIPASSSSSFKSAARGRPRVAVSNKSSHLKKMVKTLTGSIEKHELGMLNEVSERLTELESYEISIEEIRSTDIGKAVKQISHVYTEKFTKCHLIYGEKLRNSFGEIANRAEKLCTEMQNRLIGTCFGLDSKSNSVSVHPKVKVEGDGMAMDNDSPKYGNSTSPTSVNTPNCTDSPNNVASIQDPSCKAECEELMNNLSMVAETLPGVAGHDGAKGDDNIIKGETTFLQRMGSRTDSGVHNTSSPNGLGGDTSDRSSIFSESVSHRNNSVEDINGVTKKKGSSSNGSRPNTVPYPELRKKVCQKLAKMLRENSCTEKSLAQDVAMKVEFKLRSQDPTMTNEYRACAKMIFKNLKQLDVEERKSYLFNHFSIKNSAPVNQ